MSVECVCAERCLGEEVGEGMDVRTCSTLVRKESSLRAKPLQIDKEAMSLKKSCAWWKAGVSINGKVDV